MDGDERTTDELTLGACFRQPLDSPSNSISRDLMGPRQD